MLSVLLGTDEKARVLNREWLDMICAPSVVEEQVAEFERGFTAVR